MKISELKYIIDFLQLNGFERTEKSSYVNDLCNVVIENDHYAVANNVGATQYSSDLNIYWLIGVLTYYGFISRMYKCPNRNI